MKLHQHPGLFRDAVRITAQQMNIPPILIEKDYWVTYVLHTIFNHAIGKDTVFKGGTALSKCYKMIDRFSEDIDLVVLRWESETNNQLTTKIRTITTIVNAVLPEVNVAGLTKKRGMNRKTAHSYHKEFQGDYGQIRDVIVVEGTWLGNSEPFTTRKLQSFVGEMMVNNGQEKIALEYGLQSFDVHVLEPARTLCEKIMSLVRFSYGVNPIEDLKQKIRHAYDLHQLLQQQEFHDFFQSPAFDKMLITVANDDVASFKNNNEWLIYHPNEALIFKDLESIWNELRLAYNGDFKNLVYGNLPNEEAILDTMRKIKARLTAINWTIKIETKE